MRISDWSSDVCSSDLIVTGYHYAPPDFAHDLRAHLGSAFSLEPTLTQSAFFRTHNRDDMIHNLYFVGAGTHPGAGIPSVVASAKATAGLMIADLRLYGSLPIDPLTERQIGRAACRERGC